MAVQERILQKLMVVFNKTIIPLALVRRYMCLVGYLSSHIQRALVE